MNTKPCYLLWIACLFMHLFNYAQENTTWVCGDDAFLSIQKHGVPNYTEQEKINNYHLRSYILNTAEPEEQQQSNRIRGPILREGGSADIEYTIPVVVHVIYPADQPYGTGSNINYAQIRSQIEALNAAFGKYYPDYNRQTHAEYAKSTHIRFCLARISTSPDGSWYLGPGGTEYGVMRYPDNSGAQDHTIDATSATQLLALTHPTKDYFPFDKYLNIWVVSTIDGGNNVMGYAPRPIMGSYPLDGIVMRADIFGDNTTGNQFELNFGLTQGKILAHEMGHYFNLYHIFQGGCAGANPAGAAFDACDLNGDNVCDIEPCTTQNVFCEAGVPNTCSANYETGTTKNDMINDYMSYADDNCMNTFTHNQVQRMEATLNISRRSLWQPVNLNATGVLGQDGCVPPYLNAAIYVDRTTYCAGTPVLFSNIVEGNTATRRQWRFDGGLPANGTTDTISVMYNIPGKYTAYLTVTDGSTNRIDSVEFTVTSCHLDSARMTMAHWYFGQFCSLDFSSGMPVKTTTALDHQTINAEYAFPEQIMAAIQATVSVSDSSGNLLFYSNGVSVWNKDHKKVSTSSIFGKSDINFSTGLCYVPYPGHSNQYFIVGVYPNFDETPSSIRFALVDVANNTVAPYGEIKHSLLPKRFSEYLTVVPHCNGSDYWIITKGYGLEHDNNFYSFLVTEDGIDINQPPVISTDIKETSYTGSGYQLKANRTGDKLIMTSTMPYPNPNFAAALYDFDSRTGLISNERLVPEVSGYNDVQSGTAFSPNGEYFYLMRSTDPLNGPPYWLFQYRVSDFAYNIIPTTGFYFSHPFQLGPDNQLYIANGFNYLAQLANPDSWNGATFNGEFISFTENNNAMMIGASLPAFIDAKRREPFHPDFITTAIHCNTVSFSSLCFDNYIATWNFGDGSPSERGHEVTHTFSRSGTFKVKLTLSDSNKTYGSVEKEVSAIADSLLITGADSVCTTSTFATQYFSQPFAGADYKWAVTGGAISGPDNLSYIGVNWHANNNNTGMLSVQAKINDNCILQAQKTVMVQAGPVFNWILPDSICKTDSLRLSATPESGIFSGAGVHNNWFLPALAGIGNHELTYRWGEGTVCYSRVQKTIAVVAGRIAGTPFSWNLPASVCIEDSVLTLEALPAGGTCSGNGVVSNQFFPPVAGVGSHMLTYRVGNDTGCYSEIQKAVVVSGQCMSPVGNAMPGAFTPNNDGLNDVFRIPAGLMQQLTGFSVYNRWGKRLFFTNDITRGWNGNSRDMPADAGTYIYLIYGKNRNGNSVVLKGTLVLIR